MTLHVHATYRAGMIHPDRPLNLPEGAELELTVETHSAFTPTAVDNNALPPARMQSPRLARPDQFVDFQMDVREITDAGV
jgi:hypothetical protein